MSYHNFDNTQGSGDEPPKKDENDEMIDLVQSLRKKAITGLTEKGIPTVTEKDDRFFLMAMLDGAARTALALKKIKSEEAAALNNAAVAMAVARAVAQSRTMRQAITPNRAQQQIEEIEVDLVPGQTDVGSIPVPSASIRNLPD